MLPWGHLAVGYLLYTLGTRLLRGRPPQGAPVLVLVFATQFPDLVDKPLNWWFGILDGRGIAHSLLVLVPLCVLLVVLSRAYGHRSLVIAFAVGVFSHLLGDSWHALLDGELVFLSFLFWPLVPAPTYPKDAFGDHLHVWLAQLNALHSLSLETVLQSQFWVQLLFLPLLLGIWAMDGFPGVRTMWHGCQRVLTLANAALSHDNSP